MKEAINPYKIIKEVAADYGITTDDLIGEDKNTHYFLARKDCAKRMLEAGLSMRDIGRYIKKHHGTIAYYFKDVGK